eukprot:TRINITY_DN5780_c0_g1_i2.p1 TRINITY_DN5780_c0_g1~~TRINITY_DN5780_c0_g1_i2.p1  ORF type:complete len:231 (+),score=20.66 TRINITY_DN5780_c0_g1_i2:128-820(+)
MAAYAPEKSAASSATRTGPRGPAPSSASAQRLNMRPNEAVENGNANLTNRPQTMDDRRNLRHEYRGLIDKITNTRGELQNSSDNNAKTLTSYLDSAEKLFKKVKTPREAAMDVEFMRTASEVALKQASGLGSGTQALDSGAVLTALQERLENPNLLAQWIRTALPLTSPSATFLYGPLDSEVKEKEKKQIVRHKDVIEERKKLGKVRFALTFGNRRNFDRIFFFLFLFFT